VENRLSLQIVTYQVAAAYEADVEHAHLTVNMSPIGVNHQAKYYSDESEYARSRVDLPNGIDKSSARTGQRNPTETVH
jgi:hypothetical protein